MVKSFEFSRSPRILFGAGKIEEISGIAKSYGNDILLVTGKNSFLNSKHGEYLLHTFNLTGIHYHKLIVNAEPSVYMVDQAVIANKNNTIKCVIAVGGGSTIDAGKAISAMLYKTESVRDFLEGVGTKDHPGTKIPFIAVPTTSGTGTEATKNAVISEIGIHGFKKSLRHDNLMPDYAIVDPELTLNCPPDITTASGMDCFTQLVESYLSVKAGPMTDALAFDGIKYVKNSLVRSWKWGQDIEARTGMSYAALLSGICLANANLGVVHGFASSIGGLFAIPHGTVCGTLMAVSNKITVENLRKNDDSGIALQKFVLLGKLFSETENKSDDWYIDAFIDFLYAWTDLFKLNKLSKYGVTQKHFNAIISKTDVKANPVKLSEADYYRILEERL
jgi:alcohol dehydrogenase class IV